MELCFYITEILPAVSTGLPFAKNTLQMPSQPHGSTVAGVKLGPVPPVSVLQAVDVEACLVANLFHHNIQRGLKSGKLVWRVPVPDPNPSSPNSALRKGSVLLGRTSKQQVSNSSRGLGLRARSRLLSSVNRFSRGLRSGDWLDHSSRLMLLSPNHTLMTMTVCLGSLNCWKMNPRHLLHL